MKVKIWNTKDENITKYDILKNVSCQNKKGFFNLLLTVEEKRLEMQTHYTLNKIINATLLLLSTIFHELNSKI